jgi:hypothetical protein
VTGTLQRLVGFAREHGSPFIVLQMSVKPLRLGRVCLQPAARTPALLVSWGDAPTASRISTAAGEAARCSGVAPAASLALTCADAHDCVGRLTPSMMCQHTYSWC